MGATQLIVGGLLVLAVVAVTLWMYLGRRGASFEGTYTLGPEVSSFVPSDASVRYWLAWAPESGFIEAFRALGFDSMGTVRTSFEGKLETGAEAGYGHMGQYNGQVTVLKLEHMTRTDRP
jgi:hypothetical protein